MDEEFQNDVMAVVYDLKLDGFPQNYIYLMFLMPKLNGRTITYDELKRYSSGMDGSVKFEYYDADSKAKAAIMKLIRTYGNKVISEQAFANWFINHLGAPTSCTVTE
jgi:hypothetical protein